MSTVSDGAFVRLVADTADVASSADLVAAADPLAAGRRVLMFCDYYDVGSCGGAERVAAEVAKGLRAGGALTRTISVAPKSLPRASGRSDETVVRATGIDLSKVFGVELQASPTAARVASRAMREFRPDLMYAHSLHFQSSLAAARLRRRSGIPLVTTVHVGSVDELPPTVRAATRVFESTIGRFILHRSDAVIAVSDAVAAHVRSLGVAAAKINVVPNGVDHETFHPGPPRAQGGPLEVVFVGRLIANKAPEVVVRAIERVRAAAVAVRVTFVGDGPERDALEASVRSLGLDDVVRFVGEQADVADYLRNADVFVRPSLTEGMSLAVLEAMACGLCVIASDIRANRELLGDNRSGLLVSPGDSDALAAAITALASDGPRRRVLGERAVHDARERTWAACARDTSAILERVIREQAR
jgi:glycosyltransferase involved in cell wall biosynthesis